MAVDVVTSVEIGRPRAEVADFAANPDNATAWYANIKTVEWLSPPPLSVGSQHSFVASFLGRRLAYTYEVIEHVPGSRLTMSTQEGPFPMQTTYVWEDAPGGTRMTLRNRGEPSGFFEGRRPGAGAGHAPGEPEGRRGSSSCSRPVPDVHGADELSCCHATRRLRATARPGNTITDRTPAPTSAAAFSGSISPLSSPTAASATSSGSEVAVSSIICTRSRTTRSWR